MTEEELRAELAYWTADGNEFFIWYYTERIKEVEGNMKTEEEIKAEIEKVEANIKEAEIGSTDRIYNQLVLATLNWVL